MCIRDSFYLGVLPTRIIDLAASSIRAIL